MSLFSDRSVLPSREFQRIDSLPRRQWSPEQAEALVVQLTEALKRPGGDMKLFPVQAVFLYEAWQCHGAYGSLGVSAGKTLIFMLLARVFGAKNPVVFVPAKLLSKRPGQLGKTEKDIQDLSKHWDFGVIPKFVSYDTLGPKTGKGLLDELKPDFVGLDEAHKLRNPKASRTRKFRHWRVANPHVPVVAATGSSIKRLYADFAHIVEWCLGDRSPLPTDYATIQDWDAALGEKIAEFQRLSPGVLLQWSSPEQMQELGLLNAARQGVRRRLAETPGYIQYSVPAEEIGTEILVNEVRLPISPSIESAFDLLRNKWELPDGHELVEGCEVYAHARTFPLGLYRRWRDPAPKDWLEKRRAFGSFIREILSGSRRFDSPDEVADAFPDAPAVKEWRAIRRSYEPVSVPVWIDGEALRICAEWLKHGGIMFVDVVPFGEAVAQLAHVPYFGAGGLDSRGCSIEQFTGKACVASIQANGEGRNLQRFSRMALVPPPPNGPQTEQTIGRLHRRDQQADEMTVDLFIGCKEHLLPFWQVVRDAELAKHGDGSDQKILIADIDVTPEDEMPSPRESQAWGKLDKAKAE